MRSVTAQELLGTAARYDQEYPAIDYSGVAKRNCFARLNSKLASGQTQLQWSAGTGYLPSLLRALDISVESQVLVFSKTSLQTEQIDAATPRALYFNDDCYVAFIQNSSLIELTAIDADKGVVFYGLDNRAASKPQMLREGGRCLTCHDTYSMMGGGVPRVLVMTSPVEGSLDPNSMGSSSDVTDRTPIAQRWGGWYVTGRHGRQTHLGNRSLHGTTGKTRESAGLSPSNVSSLAAWIDTRAYPSEHSDLVALLVLEHQATVQNLIIRLQYKLQSVLARGGTPASVNLPRRWSQLREPDRRIIGSMAEPVVRALFFQQAAGLNDTLKGSSDFARVFQARGPRDRQGRSLRDLDLQTRVFRYPLSFLVYSEHLATLPPVAQEYVTRRIAEVLNGSDTTGIAASLAEADRLAVRDILMATHPALARQLRP